MATRILLNLGRARSIAGVLLVCLMAASAARAGEGPYAKVIRSTAWVESPKGDPRPDGTQECEFGTAVVVDANLRLLVTCYHVVQERDKVFLYFPKFDRDGLPVSRENAYVGDSGARIQGKVVARDSRKDLALIELPRLPETARVVPLAARLPGPSDPVWAIGNSGAFENAMWRCSSGTVRIVCRDRQDTLSDGSTGLQKLRSLQSVKADMIETQLPINPGDSGGPMFNENGELVGITSNHSTRESLVSYAVASDEVASVLDGYREKEHPSRWLGRWIAEHAHDPVRPSPLLPAPTARVIKVSDIAATSGYFASPGCQISVDLQVDGARGVACEVIVRCSDLIGMPLQSAPGVPVTDTQSVTPKFDSTIVSGVKLFIPYGRVPGSNRNAVIVHYTVEIRRSSDGALLSEQAASGLFITPPVGGLGAWGRR